MTDPLPKLRFRPVIRVFVSSTFPTSLKLRRASSDMRHEPFDRAPAFVGNYGEARQGRRNALQAVKSEQ